MKLHFMQSQIARVKGIHIHVHTIRAYSNDSVKNDESNFLEKEVKNMGYTKNHFI